MDLEVTMTATRRPEVVDATLSSFRENLFIDPSNVIIRINIDPIGHEDEAMTYKVMEVCSVHFKKIMLFRPTYPSFPKALIRLWGSVRSKYFWNIEDDWLLLRPINLGRVIEIMESNPDVAILRLPFRPVTKEHSKNWKFFFPWNGSFFECKREDMPEIGYCGHPSLIRTSFIKEVLPHINPNVDVEKQLKGRNEGFMNILNRYRVGVYSEQDMPEAIRDIGKVWREEQGFEKIGINSKTFETWRKT